MNKTIKVEFTVEINIDDWMSEYDIESKKEAIADAKAKITEDAISATRAYLERIGLLVGEA